MNRWVYWVSLSLIALVIGVPVLGIALDPQARWTDLFKLGIDLEGGTSLIYDLRPAEPGAQPPDAADAKRVIMGRIDPNGTRGYVVRAVGGHRLEIVLPGRPTRVSIEAQPINLEKLSTLAGGKPVPMAPEEAKKFESGTQLVLGVKPPMFLEDVQGRLRQSVMERFGKEAVAFKAVGLKQVGDQYETLAVLVAVQPTDKKAAGDWSEMVNNSLATQQDVSRVKRLVKQAGHLEFRIVTDKVKDGERANFERILALKKAGRPPDNAAFRWYPMRNGYARAKSGALDQWGYIYVADDESKTVEVLVNVDDNQNVTGMDLRNAMFDRYDGKPIVRFNMKADAAPRFAVLTKPENKGRYLAVILDGTIQTSPVLRATLSDGGIIEGYDKPREAEEVVTILNSGQLAASLGDPVTERTVGSELGADNIHKGVWAAVIGFALVILFMGGYYRLAGMVADVAMTLNLVLTVCVMSWIGAVWTLPGIAGMILSLAMAIDANVLINERLREEKGKEGSLAFALKKAYERAFTVILDSNLTTVIPAFVLLMPGLATEEVKGFAIVMVIGIGISMFTAVVFTRMVLETGIRKGWVRELTMFHLFQTPKFDWMKFAKVALIVSSALSFSGLLIFLARGDDKYDIEFTGGTQVELALKMPEDLKTEDAKIAEVRRRVDRAMGGGGTVQELFLSGQKTKEEIDRYLVTIASSGQANPAVSDEKHVTAALAEAFADLRPASQSSTVTVKADKITEAMVRHRLESASPKAEAAPPAAAETPGASKYIPPEERQFLDGVAVEVEVSPAMTVPEVQRRIDLFLRDRYPELADTLHRVEGQKPASAAGEFESFQVWIRDDYNSSHGESKAPALWSDVIKLSLGGKEQFSSTTSIEPSMAGEMWHKAVIAVVFSLAAMIIYIWLRFARFSSGMACVVATIHDVLITLGGVAIGAYIVSLWPGNWFEIVDMKMNLPMVGAFLTLVGYSVNDTIVVFDRIRENRGKYGDFTVSVINQSINQTLSRTVLTSWTVFVAVLALYFLGGKSSTIHGFSFVMLIGTFVGCWSSIAIASPILAMRDYLFRVYNVVYPILAVAVVAYFGFYWTSPLEFFLTPAYLVGTVLGLAFVALSAWATQCHTHHRPWPLQRSAPALASMLGVIGMLAPLAFLGLALVMLGWPTETRWAGPLAFGMLLVFPATFALYHAVWGENAVKRAQNGNA